MRQVHHRWGALLLAAAFCVTAIPARAAEAAVLYPSEVQEIQAGDFRRIEKVYLLDVSTDPAAISTEGFEREGYTFTLLDLLREDRTETETQPHTETVTHPSDTQDMSAILSKLDAAKEFTTEDGYSGTLALDPKSITVEAAGYQTSSKTVTASRTYPGLSDADASLLPKTVEENGRTLDLATVSWQTVPGSNDTLTNTYTATVSYTAQASSRYATGYTVTARYTGELTRTVSGMVAYTAVFSGAPPVQPQAEPETEAPNWLGIVCLVLAALLVLVILSFSAQESKRKKEMNTHETLSQAGPAPALPDGGDHHPGGGARV